MPPIAPTALLEAVAVHVTDTTGLRASARRAPTPWRDGDDPYVVVTQAADVAPDLRGDGTTLVDGTLVQASLFEAAGHTDETRIRTLVAALDGAPVDGYGTGHVRGWRLVPEPDTDDTQTAVDVSYRAPR